MRRWAQTAVGLHCGAAQAASAQCQGAGTEAGAIWRWAGRAFSTGIKAPAPKGPKARRVILEAAPPPTAEEAAAAARRNAFTAAALAAAAGAAYAGTLLSRGAVPPRAAEADLVNWSGTHGVHTPRFYQPETLAELEALVRAAHASGQRLRPVGSALSPNGLAFDEAGMVSLALMDQILSVDAPSGRVTVQAGIRVRELTEALRSRGLTLRNYASVREQTVGGFTQVSAHGTGATIPPVDEQVVALKLVTPGQGTMDLSEESDPELFRLARVGLGALGVVAEVTLQCVPAHRLVERTFVASAKQVKAHHAAWLRDNLHLRYMWIPATDAVVVVTNNKLPEGGEPPAEASASPRYDDASRLEPLRTLLRGRGRVSSEEVEGLSAMQLRDALLALGPLDRKWVGRVNAAEAEYWRRSEGVRVGWSDELLGFDCGGQQWVLEVAFPAGSADAPSGADLAYMEELLAAIKKAGVPAPAPIEQRWTAGSSSPMSPAAGPPGSLFSWVGIIMYLPDDPAQRAAVTSSFKNYCRLVERQLMPKYGAVEHWAKIEAGQEPERLAEVRARLAARYPVAAFAAARARLDPHNILANPLLEAVLPRGQAPP